MSPNHKPGRKQIMLIEDNDADAGIILEALADWQRDCDVNRFRDGDEALRLLMDEDAHLPDVILLDLNMPKSDGLDVLQKIRNTPRLTYIPVGILTGSRAPNDQRRASLIGATRYIEKPFSYDQFLNGVRQAVDDMLQQRDSKTELL
jgi:chemotaxis family two-component system response regulator Rcp1